MSDFTRYSRQMLFQPIGEVGQEKLKASTVLIVGAGALGTSLADMFARSGVGQMVIFDRDHVEWSNLQRQTLFTEQDVKDHLPKAIAAANRLKEVNHLVDIKPIVGEFDTYNAMKWADKVNLILDATDNFETRLLINDVAFKYDIPWIYGGAVGSTGMTYTMIPGITPCFSCFFDTAPQLKETCDISGVISPIIQWVTSQQAVEALKWLTGNHTAMRETLYYTDLWSNQTTEINMSKVKKLNCPTCGQLPTFPYLTKGGGRTAVLCGRDTIQVRPDDYTLFEWERTINQLKQVSEEIEVNHFLIHVRLNNTQRIVVFKDGRALFHGIKNPSEAAGLYDKYIKNHENGVRL